MTPTSTRVYLSVPFDDNDQVRLHGGQFDWERRQWWVDRTGIADHPGIARWVADRPRLVAQLHEAADFLEGKQQPARTSASAEANDHTHQPSSLTAMSAATTAMAALASSRS
jgi:hypothetical protein